jgi:hypothetical protein
MIKNLLSLSGKHHFSKINILEVCCVISKLIFIFSPLPSPLYRKRGIRV